MLPYALSFLAGLLTALSPCVLPALPLVASGAQRESRFGPLAVALGMILSFTSLGLLFAILGESSGVNTDHVRMIAALLMLVLGLVMIFPALKERFASWLAPLAEHTGARMAAKSWKGIWGQFFLGALLGALWSPCVGPTLGAALALAASSGGILEATTMMLLFGVGSTTPLVAIAYGARSIFHSQRQRMKIFGDYSRPAFGVLLLAFSLAIIFGTDKQIEAILVNLLPARWLDMVTRY
jgi:cytochrome c biogenesis protein CcdA